MKEGSVRDGVGVGLKWSRFDKVEEEVLPGVPAMSLGALDGDAKCIIGERFDGGLRNSGSVANEKEAEAHDHAETVNHRRRPEVLPGEEEVVAVNVEEGGEKDRGYDVEDLEDLVAPVADRSERTPAKPNEGDEGGNSTPVVLW